MNKLTDLILKLKKDKNAIILAHNYQPLEIQEIADFVGDSLELSIKAMETNAKIVVFCGVDFMVEQAKILNPDKIVLIPDYGCRCHMAHMLKPEYILKIREKYSKTPVVLYVNTLAENKVYADYIVTSANAVSVIQRIDNEVVIFGPDVNLCKYVEYRTGKKIISIPDNGHCYVHKTIHVNDILELKKVYPNACVIAHPECDLDIIKVADFVGSTSQMVKYVENCSTDTIIYATEVDIVNRFRKVSPDKKYIPACPQAICVYMKRINLEKVYRALIEGKYVIDISNKIIEKVRKAIFNTFELLGIEIGKR